MLIQSSSSVTATSVIVTTRSQGYTSQLAIATCKDDLASQCEARELVLSNADNTTCSDDGAGEWTCRTECSGECR